MLVGITGLGILDYKTTPLGEFVPGVEIHAQIVENIFNGVSLTRPTIMPRVEALRCCSCWASSSSRFVPRLRRSTGSRSSSAASALVVGGGLVALPAFGILLDPVLPAIGALAVFGIVLVGTLAQFGAPAPACCASRPRAWRASSTPRGASRWACCPIPRRLFAGERRFEVAALLEPARTVGGDFYDCFMIDDRHLFFVVADVSGKGLPAALFMASVKSHLKSAALRGGEVGEMLTRAQDEIARENPEQLFVTAFAGLARPGDAATCEFANAGHEPPYVRTPTRRARAPGARRAGRRCA